MVKYSSSITLPFPRERVWALMSNWTHLQTWDVNISKSVLADEQSSGARGVGTKYDCAFKTSPTAKEVPVSYTCVKYDEPSECRYVGIARLFRSQDTISLEAIDASNTRLTAEFDLTFRSLLSPLSFVMNNAMQNTGPLVMKDIDEFVRKELGKSI